MKFKSVHMKQSYLYVDSMPLALLGILLIILTLQAVPKHCVLVNHFVTATSKYIRFMCVRFSCIALWWSEQSEHDKKAQATYVMYFSDLLNFFCR